MSRLYFDGEDADVTGVKADHRLPMEASESKDWGGNLPGRLARRRPAAAAGTDPGPRWPMGGPREGFAGASRTIGRGREVTSPHRSTRSREQ